MLRSGPLKVKIYTPWLIPNTGELWHHVYMQHLWVKGSKLNFCFWVVTLGAMAEGNSASVSLDGVAPQWEGNKDLRQLVRSSGSLFVPMDGKSSVDTTVDCVAGNHVALSPVVAKLLEPICATLGMVTIPTVEAELLYIELTR